MKTIMVATDFSERSDRALRRATLLARQTGAGLSLVHVVDDDQAVRIVEAEREAAAGLLREQTATIREADGVTCAARVVMADPFAGIVQAADEIAPDLLVLGPHRRRLLHDVFVGTTAERTIRSVGCPVLMVNAPPVGPYRHALLATDLSDGSRLAIRRYSELGLAPGARASALHVFGAHEARMMRAHAIPTDGHDAHLAETGEAAARALSEFLRAFPHAPMMEVTRHQGSVPAAEILDAVREMQADLVVVGTQGRSGLEAVFLGSVARNVLRSAEVDVLAVPPSHADRVP
ncbi:nucleotide-binding universal stress UspA family protein [Rhodovulum bhavnagarense]|uniref:Nucleotide-binding universal stress UspA family protein n=1 Tax=Rhodovulum bhavnagarense TaxID=992286 RepID=A0A4V2SVI0_9RHOB|nr:universal stress protein [Rhodovulum bhavnagarense]TCP58546.1 nucleotide-binding universal stress UspA family protein [Rhodovulum bhavnagarense]